VLRDRWLVPLAFLAFVSLGLPDGVLGVAWPSLRRSFDRPVDHLGLILLATMAGYLASSFSGGALVGRLGVGRLLLWSGLLVAASAAAWALSPAWPPVLAGALASGLGAGAIDAGINAFAAARFTPRVITWLHACWGLGAMLGPLGMTAALASGLGWRAGYAGLAASLVALSVCFRLTLGLWDSPVAPRSAAAARGERDAAVVAAATAGMAESLKSPRVRRNVLVFFVYTGIESTAGQWVYTLLTESRGMTPQAAGIAASVYWGSIFAGRIAFGALAHHVPPATILRLATAAAPPLALALALTRGAVPAFASLFGLGLLLAPIFPLLIAETPARVGERHAAHAVGFQVAAATLGAGTLPALAGLLMRRAGLETLGPFLLGAALLLLVARSRVAASGEPGQAPGPA
jgi:fucose permease